MTNIKMKMELSKTPKNCPKCNSKKITVKTTFARSYEYVLPKHIINCRECGYDSSKTN